MKLKNESGITLIELLAALSLLMVVILLAGSVHMFGQRHFRSQTESASQANNISYAMSVMSSDLRKYTSTAKDLNIRMNGQPETKSSPEGNEIWLIKEEDEKGEILYHIQGNELKKQQTVIADSIESMKVEIAGTYGITITLTSDSEHSNEKVYKTTITFRGVDDNATDDK